MGTIVDVISCPVVVLGGKKVFFVDVTVIVVDSDFKWGITAVVGGSTSGLVVALIDSGVDVVVLK